MRKIVTAVTAAALSLSMLAAAVPASAVTGYDSAYAGESAFVNISPGQTLNFQVFFANTGTTTWSRGTGTQVDLAACLEDKTTCNAQDATEASWNSGWLSTTRYATTVQTTTAPGALGTFSYNIAAPSTATAGTYRFNGDLVLSSTGEKIHPDGYYQDATVGGPASGNASLTSLNPANGTTSGGNSVILNGSGFVCTPAFPSVSFGGTNAAVTSCGSSALTATAPAHVAGNVTVTATNSGGTASNGLTYTYQDLTAPTYTGVAIAGNIVTVTFSEPVCHPTNANTAPADWTVVNVSATLFSTVTGDNIPQCDTSGTSVTTGNVFLNPAGAVPPPGSFVEVTLNQQGATAGQNANIQDLSNNKITAPMSHQATSGTPETTPPTITSASGAINSMTVTVNFSEPVYCTNVVPSDFKLTDLHTTKLDTTVTAVVGCGTTQQASDS